MLNGMDVEVALINRLVGWFIQQNCYQAVDSLLLIAESSPILWLVFDVYWRWSSRYLKLLQLEALGVDWLIDWLIIDDLSMR